MSSLFQENYENLANAIILQAARDYKAALRKEHKALRMEDSDKKNLMLYNAQNTIQEVTTFFNSAWFEVLSDLNGPELLKKIRYMTMEEIRKKEEAAAEFDAFELPDDEADEPEDDTEEETDMYTDDDEEVYNDRYTEDDTGVYIDEEPDDDTEPEDAEESDNE